jgi:nucleoside-diphosphate-sugar epimerase
MTVILTRPGTIYGPGQEGSTESGWIAWFLKAKAEGITVTINGDGSQVRDLLHVDDYCDLVALQVAAPHLYDGHIWDVGGGLDNSISVIGMAEYLGLDVVYGPPRYGDTDVYIGRNDVPGWKPKIHWDFESKLLRVLG